MEYLEFSEAAFAGGWFMFSDFSSMYFGWSRVWEVDKGLIVDFDGLPWWSSTTGAVLVGVEALRKVADRRVVRRRVRHGRVPLSFYGSAATQTPGELFSGALVALGLVLRN
nr:hypothetical protein Iba_chr03cCG9210 [Ipomoea batatas]